MVSTRLSILDPEGCHSALWVGTLGVGLLRRSRKVGTERNRLHGRVRKVEVARIRWQGRGGKVEVAR